MHLLVGLHCGPVADFFIASHHYILLISSEIFFNFLFVSFFLFSGVFKILEQFKMHVQSLAIVSIVDDFYYIIYNKL